MSSFSEELGDKQFAENYQMSMAGYKCFKQLTLLGGDGAGAVVHENNDGTLVIADGHAAASGVAEVGESDERFTADFGVDADAATPDVGIADAIESIDATVMAQLTAKTSSMECRLKRIIKKLLDEHQGYEFGDKDGNGGIMVWQRPKGRLDRLVRAHGSIWQDFIQGEGETAHIRPHRVCHHKADGQSVHGVFPLWFEDHGRCR